MRVKAQQEILVGCSKRITLKNVQVFSGKTFMWLLAAPHKDENPITGEYMMGEHLGSPLQFPHLEFVLLFDIFINFISIGADLGVCPI